MGYTGFVLLIIIIIIFWQGRSFLWYLSLERNTWRICWNIYMNNTQIMFWRIRFMRWKCRFGVSSLISTCHRQYRRTVLRILADDQCKQTNPPIKNLLISVWMFGNYFPSELDRYISNQHKVPDLNDYIILLFYVLSKILFSSTGS